MIVNLWGNTTFLCGCHGGQRIPLIYKTGKTMFYSCPHYLVDNEKRPGERSCANRLSFDDAEGILNKVSELITKSESVIPNIAGSEFKYKSIDIKVMKHDTAGCLELEIINKKALK